MKQLEIASNIELVDLINYLSSGQYPSRIGDSKAAKRTYRRFASRFFYCEKKAKLFVKNEDDSLLEYYGSFQEADKLTAIMRVHQSIGHLRRDKLTSAAREFIYAPTADEIKRVLERCSECQMMFRIKTRPENKVIYAAKPGALYQADLIDLRVYTDLNDDFCWILNILDVYSKYLISVPLKAKNAHMVKTAFESSFLLFGEPKMLQTDNGKEFKNSLLREFTDSLRIRRIFGRPRHPQTQGQVERVNQTLKRMMSALILERSLGNRWIGLLQECVAIYNRQKHDATGKKPIRLFFGREVGNPLSEDFLRHGDIEELSEDETSDREIINLDPFSCDEIQGIS
ncbi:hypothetical protein ENBRE01_2067 [Enteropsectra breve]|nr:hypothetical protein ENBRE01_2067 [Enteropsectra breve]